MKLSCDDGIGRFLGRHFDERGYPLPPFKPCWAQFWTAEDWAFTKEEFYEQKRQRYADWLKANAAEPAEKP